VGMEMTTTLMNYWRYLIGIGIIPLTLLGRWAMKEIFKLIYPDEKLKEYVVILPRPTGIQIYGSKLYLYITFINLSIFYNMIIRIERASINGDNYTLDSTLNRNETLNIKRLHIFSKPLIVDEVCLEGKLNKDEREFFLKEPINKERKHLSIKINVSTKSKLFGNRILGFKILNFDVLTELPK